MIYLDHNATTSVAEECIPAMLECLRAGPANPSSKHALGERAKRRLESARAQVAGLLNAAASELVFTASGTEANHMAILGALALNPGRRHVISSEVEHPATLMLLRALQAEGIRVTLLPVDAVGRLVLEALADTLTPQTAVVSLMWANNETGVLFPIAAAAQLARERGVLFHTDAVQAAGKTPIDVRRLDVDMLSLSAHKMHAPSGVGTLFVRKGIKLPPLLHGHQERGRRGGTENLAGIAGFGVACDSLAVRMAADDTQIARLRQRLERGVLECCRYASVNGAAAPRLSNTSSISFGTLSAERILDQLDRVGIQASSGAACSSAGTRPSHVLTAMGLSADAALATVRFSLGRDNTDADIDLLLAVLPQVLEEAARRTA